VCDSIMVRREAIDAAYIIGRGYIPKLQEKTPN
jgi:hypothetical protein